MALLKDPFIKRADAEASSVNMAGYVNDVLERYTDAVDAMEVDFPSEDAMSTLKWNSYPFFRGLEKLEGIFPPG